MTVEYLYSHVKNIRVQLVPYVFRAYWWDARKNGQYFLDAEEKSCLTNFATNIQYACKSYGKRYNYFIVFVAVIVFQSVHMLTRH